MVEIRSPFLVNIDVTNRCNLKCSYCYAARKTDSWVDIDIDKCKSIITELFEIHRIFHMTIAGGEPLLYPDIFRLMEESFIIYSPRIVLLSNGTPLLKDKIYKRFASVCRELDDAGKRLRMQISLDSHIPHINDLQRGKGCDVITAINKVLELPVELQLACVITKQNIRVADQIVEIFYPHVKHFHYMNIMPSPGRSCGDVYKNMTPDRQSLEDFHNRILELEKKFDPIRISKLKEDCDIDMEKGVIRGKGCLAGTTTIEIGPNLDVGVCCMSSEVLGNLRDQGFEELWYSDRAEQIRSYPKPYCGLWSDT